LSTSVLGNRFGIVNCFLYRGPLACLAFAASGFTTFLVWCATLPFVVLEWQEVDGAARPLLALTSYI
jgi:hypothetical protein